MKKVISDINGLKTTMEISSDGKTFDITKEQDVEAILNYNKAMTNMQGKKAHDDCYNHAARIPAIIQVKWLKEDNLNIFNPDHEKRLKAKLNDPEWRYLRTNEMTL